MKWLFLFLALPLGSFSQVTAFFETPFYLEDGAGNKDTIIVGHDINANYTFNPQFGEVDITLPWDSIWEVRAAHYIDWNSSSDNLILSKKIIGDNEGGLHPVYGCLWSNEAIIIFVRITQFPLTVSWNKNDFDDSYCRTGSTITPHVLPLISEYWHEGLQQDIDYACLAERDSFQVTQFVYDFGFYLVDTIEGSFLDTIAAMLFYPKYQHAFESPCTATVSSSEAEFDVSPITLYPNPTKELLTISEGYGSDWTIYNPISYQIRHGNGSLIDVSNFGNGVHYISIFNDKGERIYTGKFVKIE